VGVEQAGATELKFVSDRIMLLFDSSGVPMLRAVEEIDGRGFELQSKVLPTISRNFDHPKFKVSSKKSSKSIVPL
jgi:hypothetical protein